MAWLKSEFSLGHGHATAIAAVLLKSGARKATPAQKLDALFSGKKEAWRETGEKLIRSVSKLGPDVTIEANSTYINLPRSKKKFGILQPSSVDRFDVGIKIRDENRSDASKLRVIGMQWSHIASASPTRKRPMRNWYPG
jgi:hypothetical protein